jgi:mRNA-degrading endonuclease RelE of RelBE toxin-antitoxin system
MKNLSIGNLVGDQIPGTGYTVFKVRLKNSNIQKGKRAGYRVIYQFNHTNFILLVTIYSKSDQNDIAIEKIKAVIANFQQNLPSV